MEQYVWFYQLPKNYNSTKQPDSSTMSRYELCTLKDDCDLFNPEILVATENAFYFPAKASDSETVSRKITDYTHAMFNGRFYNIVNVVLNTVDATIKLSVDVLASFKHGILATSQLVGRSENNYNGKITDEQTVCNGNIVTIHKLSTEIFTPGEDKGTVIIGTLNGNGPSYGTVTYYRLAKLRDLDKLQEQLFSDVEWLNISDVSAELTKALVNPLQYFVSCKQFPFTVWPSISNKPIEDSTGLPTSAAAQHIEFGFWKSSVRAWKMHSYKGDSGVEKIPFMWTTNGSVENIPKHPQADTHGEYLNLAPYSVYTLNFEPFGQIAIDPAKLFGCDRLDLYIQVDLITGSAVLTISAAERFAELPGMYVDRLISKHYANVAIDHVLAQTTTDVLGVATQTALTAVDVAGHVAAAAHPGNLIDGDSMRHVSGALTSAISGTSDIYRNSFPQSSRQGSMGNHFVAAQASLVCEFKEVNPVPANRVGKPLCEYVPLNQCRGFTRCINPVYNNDPNNGPVCTLEEQHKILSFMEEGFIIE